MYNKLGLTKNIGLFVLLNPKTDLQHDNENAALMIMYSAGLIQLLEHAVDRRYGCCYNNYHYMQICD